MKKPVVLVASALAVALVVPLWAGSSRAEGFLYWASRTNSGVAVARANLNGTNVKPKFITFGQSIEDAEVGDVAINAGHIFWAKSHTVKDTGLGYWVTQLGRATAAGSRREARLVTGIHGYVPGLAVAGKYVYWTWNRWHKGRIQAMGIGRARVDGTQVDQNFIKTPARGRGLGDIAVDSAHIYWADPKGIGRARLDGSRVDADFIALEQGCFSGASAVGVAVDASHIYWTAWFCATGEYGIGQGTTIGRANLDGSGVDPYFAHGDTGDIEVDRTHLYWATFDDNFDIHEIWRTPLDGSTGEAVIPGNRVLAGLAVDRRH